MIIIHIFGASTVSAQYLIDLIKEGDLKCRLNLYSRKNVKYKYIDFRDKDTFPSKILEKKSIFINFGPIWEFAFFLDKLINQERIATPNLEGVISCSSSSVITKRFANNKFDKDLSKSLLEAEDLLIKCCKSIKTNLIVLQPTLIYGGYKNLKDNNISKIISILRVSPLIPFPSESGLRQPIHSSQLADIVMFYINKLINNNYEFVETKIALGGENTISYFEMLKIIQKNLPKNDFGKYCLIVKIPNRIFNFICSPILLFSPKSYDSILRINCNLSGFKSYLDIVGESKSIKSSLFDLLARK